MSRPASFGAAVVSQVAMEARLTMRRGENLLAMLGIPLGVLVLVGWFVTVRGAIEITLPGTMALALVASGMVNLGIATAYERGYGVLKRLGGSPLGRSGLVIAKAVVVTGIALAQVAGLMAVAVLAFGWRPPADASLPAVAAVTVAGAAAFAGLGLTIAGRLRPEAALVAANVLFLLALAVGGGLAAFIHLPAPVSIVARALPVGALADAFAAALGAGGDLTRPLAIVVGWAVATNAVAARTFRWD